MSELLEGNQKDFKWGTKLEIVSDDQDITFFRSFTYDNVEYCLWDTIHLYHEGGKETDIGKLVKIWKTKSGGKRGKVVWFFRPMDVNQYLRDYIPSWNEVFLASGQGKGVTNLIPLEAIVGKCNVMCTAKDPRNTLPSTSDLRKADYFFSHAFDVVNLKISDKFPDFIGAAKVERLFKWNQYKPKTNGESRISADIEKPRKLKIPSKESENSHRSDVKAIGDCINVDTSGACLKDVKDSNHINERLVKLGIQSTCEDLEHHSPEAQSLKKRKILLVADADSHSVPQHIRRWFTDLPWEARLKDAHERRAIIHLVNLDPSYTSSDVKGIILSAFQLKSYAKIIIRAHCFNPIYGEALVIFEKKEDADRVINGLQQKCLLVGGTRPLIACEFLLNNPSKTCNFPGHLIMDSLVKLKSINRKAVFTSHCTQTNTVEHEMATQWRLLQQKTDLWWQSLREEQASEISDCLSKMRKTSKSVQSVEYTVASLNSPPNSIQSVTPLLASL